MRRRNEIEFYTVHEIQFKNAARQRRLTAIQLPRRYKQLKESQIDFVSESPYRVTNCVGGSKASTDGTQGR